MSEEPLPVHEHAVSHLFELVEAYGDPKMKRTVLLMLVLLLVLPNVAMAQDDGEPLRFVFVTHTLGAGVFAQVALGMNDACEQLGIECEMIGPQDYDVQEHVAILEAVVASRPDGIATTRPEPGAYDAVLQDAIDAGIEVVIYNTNDPTADAVLPLPFVGQDFTNYGIEWAKLQMRLMPDGGKIAITNCCFGHYALEERIRAFRETLENEGEGKYEIVDVLNISTDETTGYGVIEAFYQANQDVEWIVGADYYTYFTAQFIRNSDLQDRLQTGGSDLDPVMLDGLRSGYAAYGLGQNPYLQGYYPVVMMYHAIELGIRPINIDTGIDIVTTSNVDEYNPTYR